MNNNGPNYSIKLKTKISQIVQTFGFVSLCIARIVIAITITLGDEELINLILSSSCVRF